MNKDKASIVDKLARDLAKKSQNDIQPERDLWPGIEHGLAQQDTSGFGLKKYGIAASLVAALIFTGVGLGFKAGQISQSDALLVSLSESHEAHKQALLVSYQGLAVTSENWQSEMKTLDEAEKAIKKALAQSPNNPALLKILKQVYQQQLNVIERAHAPAWQRI